MRRFINFVWLSSLIAHMTIFISIARAEEEAEPFVTAKVKFKTTKGPLVIDLYRDWAPKGHDRFLELCRVGFFGKDSHKIAFFRSVEGFLTQFGISDDNHFRHWHHLDIEDDPNLNKGIKKGYLSFAGGGPNTRSTQLFIAYEDLDFLGKEPWETPFGKVVEGYDTLKKLHKGEDIPPFGNGPDQTKIQAIGNTYLYKNFPKIDYITECSILQDYQGNTEADISADAPSNSDLKSEL